MDYRSLAWTEKQWPDVGGEDLYYGGNAYDNSSGLGQVWPSAAEAGEVEQWELSIADKSRAGLQLLRTAALFTPGTLNCHSAVLADRLAQPQLIVHDQAADQLAVADGQEVSIQVGPQLVNAVVAVDNQTPASVALLRGVPFFAGMTPLVLGN
jgi:hypothetical protein